MLPGSSRAIEQGDHDLVTRAGALEHREPALADEVEVVRALERLGGVRAVGPAHDSEAALEHLQVPLGKAGEQLHPGERQAGGGGGEAQCALLGRGEGGGLCRHRSGACQPSVKGE